MGDMNKKLIVTHKNPDLDAIGSVWLFKRFGKEEFKNAEVGFVRAGDTYRKAPADEDERVIHVDTGMGKFDHHQTDQRTSAAQLVFEHLQKQRKDLARNEALKRVVAFLTETDHFAAFFWPEPTNDRYQFMLEQILNGFKLGGHGDDQALLRLGLTCLDGVYSMMKIVVEAEEELKKGKEFKTRFGKALGILTQNDAVIKLGLKRGYKVVVRKDPEAGNIRIKAAPVPETDLTKTYKAVKKQDTEGTWFFHSSRKMLLNGSSKRPGQTPSALSLEQVIKILKNS